MARKPAATYTRRLNRNQLAKYLQEEHKLPVTAKKLRELARRGKGPRYIDFDKEKISTKAQADEWVSEVEARGTII
jgi:hypothetical protein